MSGSVSGSRCLALTLAGVFWKAGRGTIDLKRPGFELTAGRWAESMGWTPPSFRVVDQHFHSGTSTPARVGAFIPLIHDPAQYTEMAFVRGRPFFLGLDASVLTAVVF